MTPTNPGNPPNPSEAQPGGRKAAMIFIFITMFIDILGIGIIIPILPGLIKELAGGTTTAAATWVGLISATYAIAQFFFAPILGALSDRFGRRPVLLFSLFFLGVDYIIQGFAPNLAWLFVGRLVAGIFGGSITTANAYVADISTPENRAQNFGLVGVAFGLGFICGPALGGLLGGIDLRLPFFVAAGLALVNWLYGFFILPESLSLENRSPFDWKKATPLGSIGLLKSYPIVGALSGALVLSALAQRALENVWVLYTEHRYGWDELTNGLTLTLVGVTMVIVQGLLVKPTIKRFGERKTILFGVGVGVVSSLSYGLATEGWMIVAIILVGSVGGVAGPAIQGLIAGNVSPMDQGKVQGALTSLISVTSIIAPLVFTSGLFAYFTSDQAPFQLPGAPFFAGSLLTFLAWIYLLRILPAKT